MNFSEFNNAYFVGFFMALMIGPVFFMLIQTSILKGAKAAIIFDLGVILGDVSFILMAYYGSKTWLEKVKDNPNLFLFGGIVLIIYGIVTYFDKKNKKENSTDTPILLDKKNYLKLFFKGFFLNFINVGVLAFWLGVVVVVAPTLQMQESAIFWYFTKVIVAYFITDLIKIILAKQLKSKMTPLIVYRFKKIMAILLIIFGVILILKGFAPDTIIKKLLS